MGAVKLTIYVPVFSVHLRAPKWLKRPVGVGFGFGGKLASFRPSSGPAGAPGNSEVK